jgi:hypothetical protein
MRCQDALKNSRRPFHGWRFFFSGSGALGGFPFGHIGPFPPRHLRGQLDRLGKAIDLKPIPDGGAVHTEMRGKRAVGGIGRAGG